jgi:hypothetical protein
MFPVLIGMIMLSLTYFGKAFGMSSNLRSYVLYGRLENVLPFFDFDTTLEFSCGIGAMMGGFVAVHLW